MADRAYNVLFLCTGNSARSIMAEGLVNNLGKGRFKAYSAGSHPAPSVNPFAIEKLEQIKYSTDNLRPKSWHEFVGPGVPRMDFVITVCDNAAGEICPVWPGQPITAHWGFADPAAVEGTDQEKRAVFDRIFREIGNRVRIFVSLPMTKLDRLALERQVRAIGEAREPDPHVP